MSDARARFYRGARAKYLGVKFFGGQKIKTGQTIVKQRGSVVLAGKNVKMGHRHTLFAMKDGIVQFITKRTRSFDNSQRKAKVVSVIEEAKK